MVGEVLQALWHEIRSSPITSIGAILAVVIASASYASQRKRNRVEDERRHAPQVRFVIDQMRFGNGWRHAVAHVENRLNEELEVIRIRIVRPRHVRVAPQKEGNSIPDLQNVSNASLQPRANRVRSHAPWGSDVYWWLKGDEDATIGKVMRFEIELRQLGGAARLWKVRREVPIPAIAGERRL